jgi:hypothetical protein
MKAGFRGWLYRGLSLGSGLLGSLSGLTLVEISRFYSFDSLRPWGVWTLALSFALFMTVFFGQWAWKKYLLATALAGAVMSLSYFAYRPEMVRDDVLKQLKAPPLSVDLWFYRGWALSGDPAKAEKIERLDFFYELLRSYTERSKPIEPTPVPGPSGF